MRGWEEFVFHRDAISSCSAASGRGSINSCAWIPRQRPRGMTDSRSFAIFLLPLAVVFAALSPAWAAVQAVSTFVDSGTLGESTIIGTRGRMAEINGWQALLYDQGYGY